MDIPEFRPLVEISRLAIASVGLVYLTYSIENLQYYLGANNSSTEARDRVIFSLSMVIFCIVQFTLTFAYGGLLAMYLHPFVYILAGINFIFYTRLLQSRMVGGQAFTGFVTYLGSIGCLAAASIPILLFVTGENYGMILHPAYETPNSLGFSMTGTTKFEPGLLYKIIMPISLVLTFSVLTSMILGVIKGRTREWLIIVGVGLTFISAVIEIGVSLTNSNIILLCFASNLPEVIRTTFVARKKLLIDLNQKEKQTIISLTATLNHELNNPLQIVSWSIGIVQKNGEVQWLDRATTAIDRMKNIISKISDLTQNGISKEAYLTKFDITEKDSVEIYKLK